MAYQHQKQDDYKFSPFDASMLTLVNPDRVLFLWNVKDKVAKHYRELEPISNL